MEEPTMAAHDATPTSTTDALDRLEARLENLEVILRDPVQLASHLHQLLASQAREVQA